MDDNHGVIDAALNADGAWEAAELADPEFVEDPGQPDLFPPTEADQQDIRRHYVYKRNELIHGSFTLSAFSLKTLSALISQIDPRAEDLKMPAFEFTVAEFAQLMKVSRQRVYRVIEDVTDELQSQIARLPLRDFEYEQALLEEKKLAAEEGRNPKSIPRPDVDPRSFKKVSWFHYSRFDATTGKISFAFHEDMNPYLRDFTGYFTKYASDSIGEMQSAYSIRLYELFRSFLSLKSAESGQSAVHRLVKYQKLRDMLNLGDKYPRFNSFEERVLKQAKKELKSSDLDFDYSFPERPTPSSRVKVTKILFHIKSRNNFQSVLELPQDAEGAAQLLPEKDLAKLISEYGNEQVSRNLAYVQSELGKGMEPNNLRGFTIACVKRDMASTDGALNPYSYTDKAHQAFITEKLMQIWDTLPSATRDEFIKHRFRKGLVAEMYKAYAQETNQRSVTDVIMGAVENNDLDW